MYLILRKSKTHLLLLTRNCCPFRTLFNIESQSVRISDQLDYSYLPSVLKHIESEWKPIVDNHWKDVLNKSSSSSANGCRHRYILSMFPYPSGSLHLGHVRIYTTSDVLFRVSHLRGYEVIHPMGFDSFGLPAENAAKTHSIEPKVWTESNIKLMRKQLDRMGFQFNWRESTSDQSYYKWTQWLFLQLYKSGLAYRGMSFVNWDPIDCTVLADEQVDNEGRSWRSGAKVEKRCHKQWLIKTNSLANDLYNGTDIEYSGHWEQIFTVQKWWIQKPNGYLFYLNIENSGDILQVFTKCPELLTSDKAFIAISSKHWLALNNNILPKIFNPFTNKAMDIRIVDNDSIPQSTQSTVMVMRECFENLELRDSVLKLSNKLNIGGYYTSDTYRDWLISRQRYWGTPIPMIYCDNCGIQPVPEHDLPVKLPQLNNVESTHHKSDEISNPIKKFAPKEWLFTDCPKCGSKTAIRETETCDTFFDSSWYFLRYASKPLDNLPFDKTSVEPTFCYVGGKEHAALHLFYARFITHFLHQKGFCNFREPFKTLLMQSIVKGKTYKIDGKYISEAEAKERNDVVIEYEKMSKSKGNGVNPDQLIDKYGSDATRWTIISVGNPETERLWDNEDKEFYPTLAFLHRILFTVEEFRDIKIELKTGITIPRTKQRFRYLDEQKLEKVKQELLNRRNRTIYKVLYNVESTYQLKTVTDAIHELTKSLRKYSLTNASHTIEYERCLATLLIILYPYVPYFAAECWKGFCSYAVGYHEYDIKKSILEQKWPTIDDQSFPDIIRFTITDERGRHVDSHSIRVSRHLLGNWTQEDIKRVIDVKEEDIEKIEIIKHVVIIVRLKNNHKNSLNKENQSII